MRIIEAVREYDRLQRELLRHVQRTFSIRAEPPWRWPQHGSFELRDRTWQYHRHGAGYRFVDDTTGASVDAHHALGAEPFHLNAAQLSEYLQSIGVLVVRHDLEVYRSSSLDELQRGLAELAGEGMLSLVPETRDHFLREYVLQWT